MERSQLVWQKYLYLKRESLVIRSGFGLYGVYAYDPKQPFATDRSESDLEHTAGMTALTSLVAMYYPELIRPSEMPLFLMAAQLHEIGEVELGDLPDDGTRDEKHKCRVEQKVMDRYLKDLPEPYNTELALFFLEFQHRSTRRGRILYCLDKLEAVFQGLIYEKEGRGGDWHAKERICNFSAQDRQNMAETGSSQLVDIWAVHFMDQIADIPEAPNFLEILGAAVCDIRGEWFPWARARVERKVAEEKRQILSGSPPWAVAPREV